MSPEPHPRGSSVHTSDIPNPTPPDSNSASPAAPASASSGGTALAPRKGRPPPLIDVLGLPVDADNKLRPGWTEKMLREVADAKCVLHSMAMFDGIAPTRKEFQLIIPSDRAFRKYYGSYTRFVQSSGYKIAMQRRTVNGVARRRAAWDAEKKAKAAAALSKKSAAPTKALAATRPALPSPDQTPDSLASKEKHKRETVYGVRLDGCDMLHAPTNEQGVVLLFGMLASKLGFLIEMVRTGYPDCEAKRMGTDGKLRKVRIEFEFLSSRFDHDPDECDLIVCWEDDSNPTDLEVLELKNHVGKKE